MSFAVQNAVFRLLSNLLKAAVAAADVALRFSSERLRLLSSSRSERCAMTDATGVLVGLVAASLSGAAVALAVGVVVA